MPQWAGSCWYYLRFLDPKNAAAGWTSEAYDAWMPVDLYVGGAEHAVLHLLYARFWHKVLFDLGLVKHDEPFTKLVHQGSSWHVVSYSVGEDKRSKIGSEGARHTIRRIRSPNERARRGAWARETTSSATTRRSTRRSASRHGPRR